MPSTKGDAISATGSTAAMAFGKVVEIIVVIPRVRILRPTKSVRKPAYLPRTCLNAALARSAMSYCRSRVAKKKEFVVLIVLKSTGF